LIFHAITPPTLILLLFAAFRLFRASFRYSDSSFRLLISPFFVFFPLLSFSRGRERRACFVYFRRCFALLQAPRGAAPIVFFT
jgi:hypothetical protein